MNGADGYDERAPVPALAGRVRTVWVQRVGPRSYLQRNLPTGGVELHCSIGGVPRLVGPLTSVHVHLLPAHTTIVGVRFWPGMAAPLFGLPAGDLVDLAVPADDVWGGGIAVRLGEMLADASDPDAALVLLQRYLCYLQVRADDSDPLVVEAVRRLMPWQHVEVGSLTTGLAISGSQLRRRFLTTVGVGPKSLQRTLRFQGYLALAQAASTPNRSVPGGQLADLAAEAGYADHPHLSRECLRLAGLTPRELLSGGIDRCGCGHDHSASYLPFLAGRPRVLLTG
ncbi:MAG: helix-turn-helix domain-containing protein [Actinomycetota bacterium]|nr:helix-turn-helix domain-containing protein [Actinomycetota bacterium]